MANISETLEGSIKNAFHAESFYVSIFRYIGTNAWIQLYTPRQNEIALFDIALFDTAEESIQNEIFNPTDLLCVKNINVSCPSSHERYSISLRISSDSENYSLDISFASCAFNARTKPMLRI